MCRDMQVREEISRTEAARLFHALSDETRLRRFYVLPPGVLNARSQHSITLKILEALSRAYGFGELQSAVRRASTLCLRWSLILEPDKDPRNDCP